MLTTSCGTRRQVITSADKLSTESCWMSVLMRTVIGALAAGVGGIVVLWARFVGSDSLVGRRKCLRNGASNRCGCVALSSLVVFLCNAKEARRRAVASSPLVSVATGAVEMVQGVFMRTSTFAIYH